MKIIALIISLFCAVASAQIVPPFGVATTQPATAYLRGYQDGQRQPATRPAATTMPAQPIDHAYTVSGALSFSAAITQAQHDHALWPAFHFAPGTYTVSVLLPRGFAGITIDGTAATIFSDASCPGEAAIVALNIPNVHIAGLTFVSQPSALKPVPARAIYATGVSGCWVDRCTFNGFAIGFCSDGGFGTHITNCGFFHQSAPHIGKSQGVFLAGSTGWNIEGNTFVHCGWADADYVSDKAHNDLLQLNHAIYINEANGTGDGIIRGNIFVDCASSAINSRLGGTYDWNVYRSNGLAADVVIQGTRGVITNSVFFGPVIDQPPYYGGGIDGISPNLTVDSCWFFNSAGTPLNPCVSVDWPPSKGPLPAVTTASVSNLRGTWLRPVLRLVSGRTVTQSAVAITPASPGQALPSLESFYQCAPGQLETILRSRLGQGDAYAIVDYADRSTR